MDKPEYWSINQIIESGKYPFTKGQLRHFVLHKEKNGLKHAIRKIGKCLIFKMDIFDKWIEFHDLEKKEDSLFQRFESI